MRTADIGRDDYCEVCNKSIRFHAKVKCELPVEEPKVEEVIEEVEESEEDFKAYLEALPVKKLKELCEEADLSKKGKKADLVARLLE